MSADPANLHLDGRVAIVTGAGQGIGRAIALVYAKAGASVVVAEWKAHRMESAVEEIRALGFPVHGVTVDVSRRDEVFGMVGEAAGRFGGLDVLVYCVRPGLVDVDGGWVREMM
ncbi:MAG: SDR family NAD(P)-dependent oxidoreductase [Candidatus Binatia bacterium]